MNYFYGKCGSDYVRRAEREYKVSVLDQEKLGKRMLITLKRQTLKVTEALMIVLIIMIAVVTQRGAASTSQQTIPTMPPPTASVPTRVPSVTPSATTLSNQPTLAAATQTAELVATETAEAMASPTIDRRAASATGVPGGGTIPQVTAATAVTLTTAASVLVGSPTPTPVEVGSGSQAVAYCLAGAGVVIILVLGAWWYVRSGRGKGPRG